MSNIAGIFKSIILVSIVSSLLLIFLDGNKLKDKVKFLSGVLIISLIIQMLSPLMNELQKLVNIFPSDGDYIDQPSDDISQETVLKECARQMSVYIKDMICGKFELTEDEIHVSVSLENKNGTVNVKGITVSITKTHLQLGHEISSYVSSLMGTVCTVIEL